MTKIKFPDKLLDLVVQFCLTSNLVAGFYSWFVCFWCISPKKNSKDLCKCFRTAKGNPPVTFAIAACETQNVSVTVLPSFGLSEGSCITAKDMWDKMVQVRSLSCLQSCVVMSKNMAQFS